MTLQEGIYHAPGRRPGRFFALLFLRAADGADAAAVAATLGELWTMYAGLKAGRLRDLEGVALPAEEDRTEFLLGFGRNAFALPGVALARPRGLGDEYLFRSAEPGGGGPLLRGSGLSYAPDVRANMATEHVCVQVIADSKLATDRAVVETWKALADMAAPALSVTTFYLGFQRNDRRSWIDFHDGLSNLRSEDREAVIADRIRRRRGLGGRRDVPRVPAPGGRPRRLAAPVARRPGARRRPRQAVGLPDHRRRRGRRAAARHRLPGGGHGDLGDPERRALRRAARGGGRARARERTSSAPTTTSARRATRARGGSSARAMSSSSGPTAPPGFRAGLNFVSFQDTPGRLLRMLTAGGWLGGVNFGGDEERLPELASLLSVYAAGVYFVPPAAGDGEAFPGAAAFGDVGG